MWSLRKSSVVVAANLVACGLVACGQAFSLGGNDAGTSNDDALSPDDTGADVTTTRYCDSQMLARVAFCDDFDDRTSGRGLWNSENVSSAASLTIDSTTYVSAGHSLMAKAGASQNAAFSYNLPLGNKDQITIDFAIKIDKSVVATSSMRFASIAALSSADSFRLDIVKEASGVYSLRLIVSGAVTDSSELKGMDALESGWHRLTWVVKAPTFTPGFTAGRVEVKLEDETKGDLALTSASPNTLADVFRNGLRLNLGIVIPAGKSEAEVHYDNVTVIGS